MKYMLLPSWVGKVTCMFTLNNPRLGLSRSFARPLYAPPRSLRTKRTYFTTVIQTLSNGVLDLAVALPYPSSFPPYSTTIIVVTVVTRLIFTTPFSIWVRLLERVFFPSRKSVSG
jgi:hypothetical protein